MATNNFYYRNASKVFAIGLDYENEDGENVSCDEFEYDMEIENVQYHMDENKGKFHYSEYERKSQLDNRNFCARYIASLTANKKIGDIDIEIEINAFSRAGYYEGACLDWELNINVDGNDSDDIDDVTYFVENTSSRNMNEGMLKIQAKNAQKWANKVKDELVALVEKSFENSSTCFVRVATFSNGETIYKKCE